MYKSWNRLHSNESNSQKQITVKKKRPKYPHLHMTKDKTTPIQILILNITPCLEDPWPQNALDFSSKPPFKRLSMWQENDSLLQLSHPKSKDMTGTMVDFNHRRKLNATHPT